MDNPLSNLNLKWWHTVLMVVSFTIFVLSLIFDMKISNNETIAFLSSGVFFIALGEFANQSFQTAVAKSFSMQKDVRRNTIWGWVFIIVGIYLLYRGIF